MRRAGPRPLAVALGSLATTARPQTLLARVQAVWGQAVGPTVAAEASPIAEAGGSVVVVACSSAVWAQELELLAPDLVARLNGALESDSRPPVEGLRFRIAGSA